MTSKWSPWRHWSGATPKRIWSGSFSKSKMICLSKCLYYNVLKSCHLWSQIGLQARQYAALMYPLQQMHRLNCQLETKWLQIIQGCYIQWTHQTTTIERTLFMIFKSSFVPGQYYVEIIMARYIFHNLKTSIGNPCQAQHMRERVRIILQWMEALYHVQFNQRNATNKRTGLF